MNYSMKKNCLLLWALLCSFSIFVSCEKDDPAWKNIPPTFEKTAITVNNTTVGGSADFVATGENSGTLTLRNVISAYSDAIKIDVVLKEESENSFTFTGETSLDNPKTKDNPEPWMTVKATGTIKTDATGKYELTVNLTTSGWNEISNTYTGNSLSLKINAVEQTEPAPVELIASSDSEATLVFENLYYPLGTDVEVPVTYSYDGTAKYVFDGSAEREPGFLVTVHATLTAGKLDIELTTSGWKKLFYNRYTGETLKMTYNGKEDTDHVCTIRSFKPSSATDAEIAIRGPFLALEDGSDAIVIPVKMEEDAATGTYSFEGNTANDTYKFKASAKGTVTSDGVMTISFDYEITSDLVGVWGVKMNGPMGDVIFQYQGADIQIPDSVYNYVPENLKQMIPQTIPATIVNQMGNALLGQYAPQLRKLEFKSDGYIDATVIKVNESEETLADDILMYYVCGDQLFVFPNLAKLMGGMMSASNRTATKAWDPNNLLLTGIPLTCNVTGNATTVTLETETIIGVVGVVKGYLPLLGMFMPEDLAPIMKMINTILGYLTAPNGGVLPNTQVLRAGLILEKK